MLKLRGRLCPTLVGAFVTVIGMGVAGDDKVEHAT